MNTKLHRAGLALLAVGALLLGGSPAAAASDGRVPFTASFSWSGAFLNPTTTTFAGTGRASHLGRITTSGYADITGSDSSCPGGVANVNTETLTAANGDTLTIVSDDVACPTGPNQYHGTGHWTVAGGTGRFDDATGSGSFDGHSDFGAGTFAATMTGRIRY
jgi:hypothetical protein